MYAQLIDDKKGHTLVFSSTLDKTLTNIVSSTSTKEASSWVGEDLAKKAIIQGIFYVVFDRGNRPYHGRIQSVAEGARKEGLKF